MEPGDFIFLHSLLLSAVIDRHKLRFGTGKAGFLTECPLEGSDFEAKKFHYSIQSSATVFVNSEWSPNRG